MIHEHDKILNHALRTFYWCARVRIKIGTETKKMKIGTATDGATFYERQKDDNCDVTWGLLCK